MVNTFHLHWIRTAEALPVIGSENLLAKWEYSDGSVDYRVVNYIGRWCSSVAYEYLPPTEWALLPKTWK